MRTASVPTLLSASRLALGPLFAAAMLGGPGPAPGAGESLAATLGPLAIALLAIATDVADGRIARRMGVASPSGASLDVAGDATFVLCGLSALAANGAVVPALPLAAAAALAGFTLSRLAPRGDVPPGDGHGARAARPRRGSADRLGHVAGVSNYAIVLAGAALPLLPVAVGWVRAASLPVAALNLAPIAIRLLRPRDASVAVQPRGGSSSTPAAPDPRDRA